MLTNQDRTVPNAVELYAEVRDSGLHYVGFKDVGAPVSVLQEVCDTAHEDGVEVMLEVVSTTLEEELESVRVGMSLGVDWILGGTHPKDVLPRLAGGHARYCPFPGRVVGHPSVLTGTVRAIVESASRIRTLQGVSGLDLLAYRHPAVDGAELAKAVARAVPGPIIAAGSIERTEQIAALARAGMWGFTVGTAIMDGRLEGGPTVRQQVVRVLAKVKELRDE